MPTADDENDGENDDLIREWVRDRRGRVGYLSLDGSTVTYASGEQRAPTEYAVISNNQSAEHEFASQRGAMWAAVCELDELNRRTLNRMSRHRDLRVGSLRYEELLQDVGVKTLRRAALLYDVERADGASLRGYAVRCLEREYAKALRRARHEPPSASLDDSREPEASGAAQAGLESRDQLSAIVEAAALGERELGLLYARYDSGETLRELAGQLGTGSPQTVLNNLNKILARCRAVLPTEREELVGAPRPPPALLASMTSACETST